MRRSYRCSYLKVGGSITWGNDPDHDRVIVSRIIATDTTRVIMLVGRRGGEIFHARFDAHADSEFTLRPGLGFLVQSPENVKPHRVDLVAFGDGHHITFQTDSTAVEHDGELVEALTQQRDETTEARASRESSGMDSRESSMTDLPSS